MENSSVQSYLLVIRQKEVLGMTQKLPHLVRTATKSTVSGCVFYCYVTNHLYGLYVYGQMFSATQSQNQHEFTSEYLRFLLVIFFYLVANP